MVRGRNGLGENLVCVPRGGYNWEEEAALPIVGIIFPRYRVKTGKILGRSARAKFPPSSPRS